MPSRGGGADGAVEVTRARVVEAQAEGMVVVRLVARQAALARGTVVACQDVGTMDVDALATE